MERNGIGGSAATYDEILRRSAALEALFGVFGMCYEDNK